MKAKLKNIWMQSLKFMNANVKTHERKTLKFTNVKPQKLINAKAQHLWMQKPQNSRIKNLKTYERKIQNSQTQSQKIHEQKSQECKQTWDNNQQKNTTTKRKTHDQKLMKAKPQNPNGQNVRAFCNI